VTLERIANFQTPQRMVVEPILLSDVKYGMYSAFNPQIIILLIRASKIVSSGFNKEISEQRFLILRK